MKSTKQVFLINIFLSVILFSVLSVLMYKLIINKEFEKIEWGTMIISKTMRKSDKEKTVENLILNFYIKNSNDYMSGYFFDYNSESHWEIDPYLNAISKEIMYDSSNRTLLPNELRLSYFSFEEKCNYDLKTVLPYSKIKDVCKEESKIIVSILPKGRILILGQNENSDNLILPLIEFQAKKAKANLDILKIGNASVKNINNLADFITLFTEKINWKLRLELTPNAEIEDKSILSFGDKSINNAFETSYRSIPQKIRLRWKNKDCSYISDYYFDPGEILTGFIKLKELADSSPIELFGRYNDKKKIIEFYLVRDKVSFALKNLYPIELHCL
ncbi:hypothetical protein [Chryseobacterium wangxinyae]|uniref:hypothetical protein n=1 Tax=Chryseobacterium sp. CY353 TaxID=2997334 RepID=UPI0022707D81|nr:hypothetical protein [Chryseobacterium sp. CY353]MCY0970731.1 hypothetical protein [Chryseobacterium sp. CY353]